MSAKGDNSDEQEFLELLKRNRDQVNAGLFTDADETVQQIFDLVERQAAENPSANWHLTLEVVEHESNRDWPRVEATYQKILALAQEPFEQYAAHRDLAAFYQLTYQGDLALAHHRWATQAARKADMKMLLLMALRDEAAHLLKTNQLEDAAVLISELIALHEDDNDLLSGTIHGGTLALRAHCHLHYGDLDETACDLKTAFQLLEPAAQMESAGGLQSSLAYCWVVEAQLRAVQNDLDGAVEAHEQALAYRRSVLSMPHRANVYSLASVANALQNLAKAQRAANRSASEAEIECREIRSFLKIPETITPA